MLNSYQIEITYQQLHFVSIEAERPSEAIELVLNHQQGEVEYSTPPEVKARVVRGGDVEQ